MTIIPKATLPLGNFDERYVKISFNEDTKVETYIKIDGLAGDYDAFISELVRSLKPETYGNIEQEGDISVAWIIVCKDEGGNERYLQVDGDGVISINDESVRIGVYADQDVAKPRADFDIKIIEVTRDWSFEGGILSVTLYDGNTMQWNSNFRVNE